MRRGRGSGCFWRVMSWLAAALVVIAAVLGMVIISRAEDKPTEAGREPVVMTVTTTTPPPSQLPETWTRYDVPIDDELQIYIGKLCRAYGVPTELVLAVIERESSFDPRDISDGGNSYGLMQIWASQHTERCIRLDAPNLLDPYQNVRVGIDYLAELIGWGEGVEYALSWYNGHGGAPCDYATEVMARAEVLAEGAVIME